MDENSAHERDRRITRTPVQARSQEKREKILSAAFELFSKSGYDTVGMRDIAAAADVSIGTVYAYFADKKKIFIEVFTLYSAELKAGFFDMIGDALPEHPDIEEFIYGIISRFFTTLHGRLRIHRDCVVMSLTDKDAQSVYAALERQGEETIMNAFFERFGGRLEVRDREAVSLVVHKTVDEIVQYLLFYEVPIERDRIFRETARMIARYLEKRE